MLARMRLVPALILVVGLMFQVGCGNSTGTIPALTNVSHTNPITGHTPFPITHDPPVAPGGGGGGPQP
jgi:hypothetical protein